MRDVRRPLKSVLALAILFAPGCRSAAAIAGCILASGCGAGPAIDGLSVRWSSTPDVVRCSGQPDQPYDFRPAQCEWACAEFEGRPAHVFVFFSVTTDAQGFATGDLWIDEPCI